MAYYIPSLLGGNVAIAVLWRFLFRAGGSVNRVLGLCGMEKIAWFSAPTGAMAVIVLLKVGQFGSSMLIFLAALKDVPKELYEAASVDEASKWRCFLVSRSRC